MSGRPTSFGSSTTDFHNRVVARLTPCEERRMTPKSQIGDGFLSPCASASRSKGMVTSRRALQASVSYDCFVPYFLSPWPAPRIIAIVQDEFDLHPRILLLAHRNGPRRRIMRCLVFSGSRP